VEPLNAIDLAVIERALSLPEMARFADQVVTICHKLGLAPPEWTRPLPPPGRPPDRRGS
jgi:hypothetical protein